VLAPVDQVKYSTDDSGGGGGAGEGQNYGSVKHRQQAT